jgi:hypothetical protein
MVKKSANLVTLAFATFDKMFASRYVTRAVGCLLTKIAQFCSIEPNPFVAQRLSDKRFCVNSSTTFR